MFNKIPPIISGYIIFIILFFVFVGGKYYYGGDLEATELTNFSLFWKSLFLWNESEGFGSTSVLNHIYSIIYYTQGVGSDIFGATLSQNLFYLGLYSALFFGFYYISFYFIKDKKYSSIFSIIFIFSYTLQTPNTLILPFIYFNMIGILVIFLYGIEKNIFKQKIFLFFLAIIFGIVFKNFANFILLGIFFTITSIYKLKFQQESNNILKNILFFYIITLLLLLPAIITFFMEYYFNLQNNLSDNWNTQTLKGGLYQWKELGLYNFFIGLSHDFFISWHGKEVIPYSWLFMNPVYQLLVYIPIILIILGYISAEKSKKPLFLYGFLFFLITLFLAKGSAEPFGEIYEWALDNIPLFVMFRNPTTKFLIYFSIATFILLLITFSVLKKKQYKIYFILTLVLVYNTPLIITQDLLHKNKVYSIEKNIDYLDFCEYINNSPDVKNIIILPLYNSVLFASKNDNWEGYDLLRQCSKKSNWSLGTGYNQPINRVFFDYLKNFFYENPSSHSFSDLKIYNISHIVYHKDADLNYMPYGAYVNESILENLEKNISLEKKKESKNLVIFKIKNNHTTTINGEDISFQKKNPTKYTIHLKDLVLLKDISFLQSFNQEWKIFLKTYQNISGCKSLNNKNITTECEYEETFFEGEELSYLYKKPLFENTHSLVYDYANGWTISKDEIISYVNENYSKELQKEGYPKQIANGKLDYKYYVLNSDGSIDVELTLYFKPQSYFYLGLIISGTTFIILVGYLTISYIRNRKEEIISEID